MKIESSRQTFIEQTDRRTFAFLELLKEPKIFWTHLRSIMAGAECPNNLEDVTDHNDVTDDDDEDPDAPDPSGGSH